MPSNLSKSVRELVRKSRLKEALQVLKKTSVADEVIILQAQLENLQRKERLGIESSENIRQERSRITLTILELTNILEDSTPQKQPDNKKEISDSKEEVKQDIEEPSDPPVNSYLLGPISIFLLIIAIFVGVWAVQSDLFTSVDLDEETLRNPVILIKSGIEVGTGFFLGEREETLYFLTALHVIEDPREIEMYFHKGQNANAKVYQSSEKWDLAVITYQPELDNLSLIPFPFERKSISIQDEVITIGHPVGNDWEINYQDEISALRYDQTDSYFTITPKGIEIGSSGSPVLNNAGELLGMVIARNSVKAICVSKGQIKEALKEWNVPFE